MRFFLFLAALSSPLVLAQNSAYDDAYKRGYSEGFSEGYRKGQADVRGGAAVAPPPAQGGPIEGARRRPFAGVRGEPVDLDGRCLDTGVARGARSAGVGSRVSITARRRLA